VHTRLPHTYVGKGYQVRKLIATLQHCGSGSVMLACGVCAQRALVAFFHFLHYDVLTTQDAYKLMSGDYRLDSNDNNNKASCVTFYVYTMVHVYHRFLYDQATQSQTYS
jgi:hypothetical protein